MEQITVSTGALTKRINRILAKDHQKLCASRSWQEKQNIGNWHVVDIYTNTVKDWFLDLEVYGRDCGALRQHECLAAA